MTESSLVAVVSSQDGKDGSTSSASSTSSTPSTSNGTGVFIPACILDGSALTNPAIAAKFPRRQRRGSAPPQHSDASKQHNISPTSRSDSAAVPSRSQGNTKQQQQQQHQAPVASAHAHPQHAAGTPSAKNPFAATPKNIRQQQLLCNLVAAADSFQEAATGTPSVAAGSRGPSLDLGHMPPPAPAGAARQSLDYARQSLDYASMSRAASRTSLDSYGWGYMRNSCDLNQRQSMDSYAGTSIRSSMDHASTWSGRPSVDSSFSCYAPVQLPPAQQQQQAAAAAAAAAAVATAAAARASFESALPPTPAGGPLGRMGMWSNASGRPSVDISGSRPSPFGSNGFQRGSLDSAVDCRVAAAAAANAMQWQQQLQQQQRVLAGLPRHDSSTISTSNMSNVSSSSMDSSACCTPSPAAQAELAAMAAALAAQCNQAAQMQQLLEAMRTNGNAETAPYAAQGTLADPATLMMAQAAAAASVAGGNGNTSPPPEVQLFQQQLQLIMQANQTAAAAAAQSMPKQYAPTAYEQQSAATQRWGSLPVEADTDLLGDNDTSLNAVVSAASLQQQLEMLQLMQL